MTHNAAGAMLTRAEGPELTIERTFEAPRELVFNAFSNADALARWWGPKDWTLPVCNLDFRPGGVWHYCMRGPNGDESWGKATYHEIVPPERIVYTDAFSDAEGNTVSDMPESRITMTFEDLGGKTRLISHSVYASAADLESVLAMGMEEGTREMFERLDAYLATL